MNKMQQCDIILQRRYTNCNA